MPRLRQNYRERSVGMVQTGMTHQTVADHSNVSRITISRLMIRLRYTVRTHVTSQRQDRHLRIIHLWNSMITAEGTARRTSGLANVRISSRLSTEDFVNLDSQLDVRW